MNKTNITKMTLIIVALCFFLSTFVSLWSLQVMVKQNSQEIGKALTAQIYDTVSAELSEPIIVSRTMSKDLFLISILEEEAKKFGEADDNETGGNKTGGNEAGGNKAGGTGIAENKAGDTGTGNEAAENGTDEYGVDEEAERLVAAYLTNLREGMDYETAFVVSEASRFYYTFNGVQKIMDLENSSYDQWYTEFISQGQPYAVDVNRDELNSNDWTVFVNARVENEEGRLLGVCGVGIHMKKSQALFRELENEYQVKIDLIDSNGLVKVDTDEQSIESAYITDVVTRKTDSYIYQKRSWDSYAVTRYIDRLGWYLVVQSRGRTLMQSFTRLLLLNIVSCLVVMAIIVFTLRIIAVRAEALSYASFRDQGTGLFNRRAFEEEKERLNREGIEERFVYVTADLNGLKTVNDTLGHQAGDELIKGGARCLEACLGAYGKIYRIGGDEYAAMIRISEEELKKALQKLEQTAAAWKGDKVNGVSLSVGYATRKEFPSENISEIMRISDERMYAAKEAYYQKNSHLKRRS